MFWTPGELASLRGTELERDIAQELEYIRSDYEDQIEPLIARHGLQDLGYSFQRFQAAASLVASRAFKVDDYLGMHDWTYQYMLLLYWKGNDEPKHNFHHLSPEHFCACDYNVSIWLTHAYAVLF